MTFGVGCRGGSSRCAATTRERSSSTRDRSKISRARARVAMRFTSDFR
jgi:hypothetical protein